MRAALPVAALAALVTASGCNDFATPAELAATQILAVRADSPAIPTGERTRLSILVADSAGVVPDPVVTWQTVSFAAGRPPIGAVEVDGGEPWYRAPDALPDGEPTIAVVQATVTASGRELIAVKGIGVGLPRIPNIAVTELAAAGAPVAPGEAITAAPGARIELDVRTEPPAGEDVTYAWYATTGTLELYRRTPVELEAPEVPGAGWVIAVVRDGTGGVDWRIAPVDVR